MQYFYECYPNSTDLGFIVRLYLIIEQIQLLSLFGKQRCTVSCAPKIGPVVFVWFNDKNRSVRQHLDLNNSGDGFVRYL